MEEQRTVGVFLARMQPLHNGHLALIKSMARECQESLILIGSADKVNSRNPIPASFRRELLISAIKNDPELANAKITIVLLSDLTSEEDNSHDWGFYLYSNIVKWIGQHNFRMYYSDGWEIITKWFPGFILQNHVDLNLIARNNCKDGISATQIRSWICDEDIENLKQYLPAVVLDNLKIIKAFIEVWQTKI